MRRAIEDPESLILDTRGDGEWFGTDQRAARNGTIPSAVHLEWVHLLSDDGQFKAKNELEAIFRSRAIPREKEILAFATRAIGRPTPTSPSGGSFCTHACATTLVRGKNGVTPTDATRAPDSALD